MTENEKDSGGAPTEVIPERTEKTWPPGKSDGESASSEAAENPTAEPKAESAGETADARAAALEAEKAEMRERMLRIAAEFENFKKRARRELGEAETRGKEAVLRDILEVVDNLERAIAFGESIDAKSIHQGVALVLRQFQSKLERYDVRAIESKGQPFDPRHHEAISRVSSGDVAPGTIMSELQKGYRMGERLLRPAAVVVAVGPAPPPSDEAQAPGGKEAKASGGDEAFPPSATDGDGRAPDLAESGDVDGGDAKGDGVGGAGES